MVIGKKMMLPNHVAIGSNQELMASSTGEAGAAEMKKLFIV